MKLWIKILIFLSFVSLSGYSQLSPGFNKVYIKNRARNGASWFYFNIPCEIWCPSDWNQANSTKYPIIISYHGTGEAGSDTVGVLNEGIMKRINNTGNAFSAAQPAQTFFNGQEVKFVVIAPQASSYGIDTNQFVPGYDDITQRLMRSTGGTVKMDSTRVYITGYSAGGRTSVGNTCLSVNGISNSDTTYSSYITATVIMSPATQDVNFPGLHQATWRNIHWLGLSGASDQQYQNQMWRVQDTIKKYGTLFPVADTVSGMGHGPWAQLWDTTYLVANVNTNIYKWLLQWQKGVSNIPPTVSAGSAQSITQPTSSLTLTGTASGNNGATIVSHNWNQVSGPSAATITSPSSLSTTVTGLSNAGNYIFQFQATDNNSQTNFNSVTDTVKASGTSPTAHAGGTYNVDQSNAYDLLLDGSTSTGSNLKYSWTFPLQSYTGNNKVTALTATNGEPRILGIKGANASQCHIIQMKLLEGDSIHVYKLLLTITDTVQNLTSSDTATVVYRYWHKYPPQNTNGSAGGHRALTADSLIIGPACKIGIDWVISGANTDGIHDATGATKFLSFLMFPNFLDTFHVAAGGHVWIPGGEYYAIKMQWDTLGTTYPPLGDTSGAQVIIAPIPNGNPVHVQDVAQFVNIRNVRITGAYDPILHLGNINYQGNSASFPYCDTMFYWLSNNHYRSIAGFGWNIDGMSSSKWELDHIASIRGNFSGVVTKFEYSGLANPSTHSQLYWDSCRIHDCFVSGAHGEDYYFGSANAPSVLYRGCSLFNNISMFSGNKLFKTLDLLTGNQVYNNVGLYGSIDYASPFEENVSVGQEVSVVGNTNSFYKNLILGFGNQGLNFLTTNRGTVLSGTANRISNNAYLHSWGPIGVFIGQEDSAFTLNIDSNYFGLHGPFNFGQVYNSGSQGTNTIFQIKALPAGSLSGGYTRSTYNISNTNYDSTKSTLFNGTGTTNFSNNTIVSKLAFPSFVSLPFTTTFPEQWVDKIYAMWGDEYPQGSDANQNQPKYYQTGDVTKWFDKFYQSKISNNNNHVPSGSTDAFWTLLTWNGNSYPPIDPRLYSTDNLAKRGIGLLQQYNPGTNCNCLPIFFNHHKRFL